MLGLARAAFRHCLASDIALPVSLQRQEALPQECQEHFSQSYFQVSTKSSSADTMRPDTLTSWLLSFAAVLAMFSTATVH